MVHPNSKKIKKVSQFGQLVQQKTQRQTKIVDSRSGLLKEYKSRNNKNSLEDRRFLGKKQPGQKFLGNIEKKNRKKLAFFNLDSDDEQQLNMTHKGVNLDQIDDFKDNDMDKSFSDDDNIGADMVNNLHFGGFDDDQEKDESGFQQQRKSKQEIYKELIHNSKKQKFLRQQQQLENEQKIEELDENFGAIFHLLASNPEKYKEEKRQKEKEDSYVSLQNQLAFDKRIKLGGPNAQDPKKNSKKGKKEKEVEEDSGSDFGVDEEITASTKKDRKLKNELRDSKKEKKFYDFMDDIKKIKEKGNAEEDSLDELDIEDEEDDYDDEDEDGEDDEEGEFEEEEDGDDVDDDEDDE